MAPKIVNCKKIWFTTLNNSEALHSAGELLYNMETELPIDVTYYDTTVNNYKVWQPAIKYASLSVTIKYCNIDTTCQKRIQQCFPVQ